MTLANLDQALKDILIDTGVVTSIGLATETDDHHDRIMRYILEAMRRAYRLAESKEEMMKMIGEPPASQA